MAVRLWHQSMTEVDGVDGYRRRLQDHAHDLFGADVEVAVHGVAAGSYGGAAPTDVLGDAVAHRRIGEQSLVAARTAQREGYDAFVIGSFSEPLLWQTRAAVDVPVVSLTESTLLTACSLGRRALFVANAPPIAEIVTASIEAHGLTSRSAGAFALDPPLTEPQLVGGDSAEVVEIFVAATRSLLGATHADVVVPAEGVLCEVLHEHGLHDLDGVPVLDSVGVTWRHALMHVAVRRDARRTPG